MISVTAKKDGMEATVEYEFGSDIEDAVKRFGKEVVFSNYVQAAKITLQAGLRRVLVAKGDPVDFAKKHVPGIQAQRSSVPARVAMVREYKDMTPAERKAFLAELKADA